MVVPAPLTRLDARESLTSQGSMQFLLSHFMRPKMLGDCKVRQVRFLSPQFLSLPDQKRGVSTDLASVGKFDTRQESDRSRAAPWAQNGPLLMRSNENALQNGQSIIEHQRSVCLGMDRPA
mmetsp:Transcript_58005/g.126810  ORF Transcript_58005/g.126810 Transcript_58005/m.126810 type:complete len:121 (+) Transcript_58005:2883-3245(+)